MEPARNFRPLFVPQPYQHSVESGRVILRDGSVAQLRVATPADRELLQAFFERMSPESRRMRFFSFANPSAEFLDQLVHNEHPETSFTLVVLRERQGHPTVSATASYYAKKRGVAEVAFSVEDAMHGKGLGSILLERLAIIAASHGFQRFWAVTHLENSLMKSVFVDSGFEVSEHLDNGYLEFDFSVVPSRLSVERQEMRDRVATVASLRPFFQPNAVAVIGASRRPDRIGNRIVKALVAAGFPKPIYPINPKAESIDELKAYASLAEVPGPVDLAVIAVPTPAVLDTMDECARKGVRAVVVITAGFAEAGGRELQDRLVQKTRGAGIRMIGPNCLGLISTASRLNASFSPIFPLPGSLAMSSQSGALGIAILDQATRMSLGLSAFVSVGNKADVSGNDLLQYWEEDEGTRVILLYLESFGNPRRFSRIARRVSLKKPIVAVKGGRTQTGTRAAGSHTAALAASDTAVEAMFRQAGVIRAETLEELFDLALVLESQPVPRGRRVGVLTNAGGPGILCADMCEANDLTLPVLSEDTRKKLRAFLPSTATTSNPVDMIASATPDQFHRGIETLVQSKEVDAIIVIGVDVGLSALAGMAEAVRHGAALAREARIPILACWMPAQDLRSAFAAIDLRTPVFQYPEKPACILGKMVRYGEWRDTPLGMIPDFDDLDIQGAKTICATAMRERGDGWLTAEECRAVLTAFRLPVPNGGTARTAADAVTLARECGFPVVLKLSSHTLVHKTEIGGVRLNLKNDGEVREAFEAIRSSLEQNGQLQEMDGVLVQPMIRDGVEMMAGMSLDPLFGPLIAFGLGGIHVEILGDVCFRISPLTDRDAVEMIRSLKGRRLLEGYRGHAPADIPALEQLLLRLSRLVEEIPAIVEMDFNPIMALAPGKGCAILDSRIRVRA